MSIENILAELIAAVKENTAALMSARVEVAVAEAQVSTGSMLIDKTDEDREMAKLQSVIKAQKRPEYNASAVVSDTAPLEATPEPTPVTQAEGDPEAIVDMASPAYGEMKEAVLAVARLSRQKALAILAEFGISKMTEAKNKDVAEITTKMRAALDV